jgi:hypothetical protein
MVMTLLTNSAHDGTIDMAFSITPSLLPKSELWTVKQSWIMQRKAITPETHIIESDENLINLIIHAWQGDKNAMIQYARIQFLVDDNVFLEDFYKKMRTVLSIAMGIVLNALTYLIWITANLLLHWLKCVIRWLPD